MTFTPCVAEATTVFEGEEIYYVVRPHIKFVMEDGESTRLSFGDKVTVTSTQDNYAFIETADVRTRRKTVMWRVTFSERVPKSPKNSM